MSYFSQRKALAILLNQMAALQKPDLRFVYNVMLDDITDRRKSPSDLAQYWQRLQHLHFEADIMCQYAQALSESNSVFYPRYTGTRMISSVLSAMHHAQATICSNAYALSSISAPCKNNPGYLLCDAMLVTQELELSSTPEFIWSFNESTSAVWYPGMALYQESDFSESAIFFYSAGYLLHIEEDYAQSILAYWRNQSAGTSRNMQELAR